MLSRVFWFTSAAALGAICLLRANVEAVDQLLSQIDPRLETESGSLLPIPAGTLLPALAVGLLFRVFRLHGHLAHWLGIRERFDIEIIIAALARDSGVELKAVPDEQWQQRRHEIMRSAFYRYASSKSPAIDPHLIHQALDSWSWFWSGLEAAVVFVVTSLVLVACNAYAVGGATLFLTLTMAFGGLPLIRQQCRRYALAQVKAIMAEPGRAAQVREALDGLPMTASDLKHVA